MKWKDFSLKIKLWGGFGLILILLIFVIAFTILNITNITGKTKAIEEENATRLNFMQREIGHIDWVSAVKDALIEGSESNLRVEADYHKCNLGKWYYGEDRKKADILFPELKEYTAALETPHIKLHESVNKIREYLKTGDFIDAREYFKTETLAALSIIRDNIGKLNKQLASRAERDMESLYASVDHIMRMLIIIAILIVLSTFLLIYFVIRSITSPITIAMRVAAAIGDGDFTVSTNYTAKDEIGRLLHSMDKMVISMKRIILSTRNSIESLTGSIEEIASGNQDLATRTTEQASAIEEISATMEEMMSAIALNSENSRNGKAITDETLSFAAEGNKVISNAIGAISELSVASKKISEITVLINDIAFQTNLLALNAAIEAARAGDVGRGFAVVAGEVRNLASRSASAAKEIGLLIDDTVNKVETGTTFAKQSGQYFGDILSSLNMMAVAASEVTTASEEQKSGVQQINGAIESLNTVIQQNAALVEQIAATSGSISQSAQELLGSMMDFKTD